MAKERWIPYTGFTSQALLLGILLEMVLLSIACALRVGLLKMRRAVFTGLQTEGVLLRLLRLKTY